MQPVFAGMLPVSELSKKNKFYSMFGVPSSDDGSDKQQENGGFSVLFDTCLSCLCCPADQSMLAEPVLKKPKTANDCMYEACANSVRDLLYELDNVSAGKFMVCGAVRVAHVLLSKR
jgi:hypothetical protein